ncbi:DUF3465 domain-containing protein [Desulfofustis glycolicus]|uniref:DUF3465 domain-containing protein n=1 Tax=Desulfofustis glycolicus DSM 9705 TaxID=1121409 RepID=A0A1M5XU28_9BACT|nr:DUF3465 domain-containing protein [Desulfofustis glycolicus]SHI03266.1 Protein of unknown function [Desulfofustis glycolicus DSM 9705]
MRQRIVLVLLLLLGLVVLQQRYHWFFDEPSGEIVSSAEQLQQAFRDRRSSIQVEGRGTIIKVLKDDRQGSRHQRFILELPTGQTLLVSHNIDLAPRIDTLRIGDQVEFFGIYEYNDQGGVIHWTHHDPAGRHVDGWIRHNGRLYR